MQTFAPERTVRALDRVERSLDLATRESQSAATFNERRRARLHRDRLVRQYRALLAQAGQER
jgi:hypothetical protein